MTAPRSIEEMPTANLVVALQKLAESISYYTPSHRRALLTEAARRLSAYRQAERQQAADEAIEALDEILGGLG